MHNFRKVLLCFLACSTAFVNQKLSQAQTDVDLVWSEDGNQCLYQNDDKFYLIDVASKTKEPLFDGDLVADVGKPDDIIFGNQDGEFVLRIGNDFFSLKLADQKLAPIKQRDSDLFPSRLSLPVRGSANGGADTQVVVKNQTGDTIQIFWVDSRKRSTSYGAIEPGSEFRQSTYVGHEWLLKSEFGAALGSFRTRKNEIVVVNQSMLDRVRRSEAKKNEAINRSEFVASRATRSPDKQWRAIVRDDNLWLKSLTVKDKEEIALSDDGTLEHTFRNAGEGTRWFDPPRALDVRWSPNSEYLIAFQTRNPPQPIVNIVNSSPRDQLQPMLLSMPYAKPGDSLPQKTLRLFSMKGMKEIPVSDDLFKNPFRLSIVRWAGESRFWLKYNGRGHQAWRLVEVDAATGKTKVLIEETSDTFIHYSDRGKSFFSNTEDGPILRCSERSGWNHLYRFDATTGKLLNAVTKGQWNVKRIFSQDHKKQVIWFYAVGALADQDPYHEHFCRVDYDGSNFQVLTEGDGTHEIQFQSNKAFFVDSWSRVDHAPVTELRSSETGELVVELSREKDADSQFGKRKVTTRFSAKGRDGKTDIWGIIHWPKDFDSNKKYPVVENIYAGPHDHHVPKKFRSSYRTQHSIADEGMIVVQIDGMGTAWRSKEFHDYCYKNLRDGGFPDRIAWIKAAAEKYPQMDVSKVGIYGGSAGGQNAMAALLWHNDFYKVAVADCGCHDNRMDKIWWNEQWMGWPVDESYTRNSNMENAHLLKGHLMLTVGELDRNVDPATTTQVVKKLIEHNKDFEYVLVAGAGHGAGETPWASRKRLNFLKRHLLEQ